jgi:hypothetical protein
MIRCDPLHSPGAHNRTLPQDIAIICFDLWKIELNSVALGAQHMRPTGIGQL